MGGMGSTRWGGHWRKGVVEDCLVLDCCKLMREGVAIREYTTGSLSWSCPGDGEKRGSVGFYIKSLDMGGFVFHLLYTVTRGDETQDVDIPIRLQATHPHYGGVRWWFTCPLILNGVACNRRVQKLYLPPGGNYFGCRHCHRLSYAVRRASGNRVELARLKMKRVRAKLDPDDRKPKGMRWKTYDRLWTELCAAYREEDVALEQRFDALLAGLNRQKARQEQMLKR